MPDTPDRPELPPDEELRNPFEKIREELKAMELPELPEGEIERLQRLPTAPDIDHDAVHSKLDELEGRMRKARGTYATAVNKPSEKSLREDPKIARSLARGMTVAYTIMGFPMIGLGIGWLIDWKTGVVFCKGIGVLGGAILGVTMAVHMVNENAKRDE